MTKTLDQLFALCATMHADVHYRGDVPEGDHETWTVVQYTWDNWVIEGGVRPVVGEGPTLHLAYGDFCQEMMKAYMPDHSEEVQ